MYEIIMIDPSIYLYAAAYRQQKEDFIFNSEDAAPLSEDIINTIADIIGNCANQISLSELEELCEEEDEDA